MKIAGIENESICANEASIDDVANGESLNGTDLSAKASSAIEGEITP